MFRMGNFLNFRRGVITNLLMAGALACAVAPGSVFATATYDAGAFIQFIDINPDEGLSVELLIDDSTVTEFTEGDANVIEASSTPALGIEDFDSQIVRVTGDASSPATGTSTSSASASNIGSLTVINPTDEILDVVIDFFWGWDAAVTLDDPLLETAGASIVSLLMETVFGESILNETFDLVAAGSEAAGDMGSFTLSVAPGGLDGIQTFLDVEGIAIAAADDGPTPGVPGPATLALMCIGLISLASRKRSMARTD